MRMILDIGCETQGQSLTNIHVCRDVHHPFRSMLGVTLGAHSKVQLTFFGGGRVPKRGFQRNWCGAGRL